MLFQKGFRNSFRFTIYDDSFTGHKPFVAGGMGIAGGDHHCFAGSKVIGVVVDMINAAAGFQVKNFTVGMDMLVGHRKCRDTYLLFNIDTIVIIFAVYEITSWQEPDKGLIRVKTYKISNVSSSCLLNYTTRKKNKQYTIGHNF